MGDRCERSLDVCRIDRLLSFQPFDFYPQTHHVEVLSLLEWQREAIAGAVSTLPMVSQAVWSTQSTLQVYLVDTREDAMPGICPLVERYPDLASSRIQLTPPAESDAPVRFRQCRVY